MINNKKLTSFFIISFIFCISAFSQQENVLNNILSKTAKLAEEHPIEKVYLHLDKPYYAAGDTIWLKAYVTSEVHQPSSLSKIVYIDLRDQKDSLIHSLKLALIDGVASGDISLPLFSTKQGNYHLRAYTAWMRNFDTAYFFNKTIPIGNLLQNDLLTHITYKNSLLNDKLFTNTLITFKESDNKPVASKKVNWKVESNEGITSKGKGTTDANGSLNIDFPLNKNSKTTSEIVTEIDYGNKKIIFKSFPITYNKSPLDIQFFPEGGELINGIVSKIAFKAIQSNGLGINIKGNIIDKNGKVLSNISSSHIGIGSFLLSPEAGNAYKAAINLPDGSIKNYDLPKALPSGFGLTADNSNVENIALKVEANDLYFENNKTKYFYITGQSGGIIYYAAKSTLTSKVYNVLIPKTKFPTGIVQLTLFSSTGEPISERILFIQHDDQLNITINNSKTVYQPRQKVKLNIAATNNISPTESSLSVSVIDESKVLFDDNAESTILTNLLLTSDLKGYIEKPNYYFLKPDEKTKGNLDLLMLTQGYRRFSYKDILADKFPTNYFLPEQSIEITGTLRTLNGMPINKGNVRLTVLGKSFSAEAVTNSSGAFKFSNVMVTDSSKVSINARNNANNSNLMIMLDQVNSQDITINYQAADEILNIDSVMRPFLLNSKKQYFKSQILDEVIIKATSIKKRSHADHSALKGLSAFPDQLIDGKQLQNCALFINCFKSLSSKLTFKDNFFYISRDFNSGNKTPVELYLNDKPIDFAHLNSLNSFDIESVEIFNNDGLSGINKMSSTNGVVVINTKETPKGTKISKEDFNSLFPPKYLVTFIPKGYNVGKVFYSPKYDGPKNNQPISDYRSTIYWNPDVITDKPGNATVEFYTADGKGTYKVVIEGINNNGQIGRCVYRYAVQ